MKAIYKFKELVFILILSLVFLSDSYGQGKKPKKGPPSWAPAHGYRANTRHIYFPEQNIYYDVQKSLYISLSGDKWQVSVNLPSIFSGIDMNIAVKVELDLSTDTPQKYNSDHLVKFKVKAKNNKDHPKNKPNKGGKKKN